MISSRRALPPRTTSTRSRCEASPAFRPNVIGNNIADAFRTVWRRWCDDLPPESFSVAPRPGIDGESK